MEDKTPKFPLLPVEAIEYFNEVNQLEKNYLKAVNIRYCLEVIINTVFMHIAVAEKSASGWNRKNLCSKIESLKCFFPQKILQAVHRIREITNKGAHQSGHKELDPQQVHEALCNLSRVCEWVISSYLQKYGFNTVSWAPTVLSALQPCYRIRILEELLQDTVSRVKDRNDLLRYQEGVQEWETRFEKGDSSVLEQGLENNQNSSLYQEVMLVIDKLAMAYLKDRRYEKSIAFVGSCFEDGLINTVFREQMRDKLDMLQGQIDSLPIAQNIEQSKAILEEIVPLIQKREYSVFIVIVMAIVAQDELEKNEELRCITSRSN